MTKGSDRLRKALLLASVTTVSLLIACVAAEVLVRYREVHRSINPDAHPTMYYRTTRLPHALVRDFDYYGWLHINSHGFRGPEVSVSKPSGVFRVMAVGGSTTFDTAVSPDDATWPARLAHWLGQEAPGLDVEVINAGVSGYTVLDNTIRLQTQLHRFQPDLIVLYHTHNDLSPALRPPVRLDPHRPGEVEPATPWGHWLERNSLFYNKLRLKWGMFQYRRIRSGVGEAEQPALFGPLVDEGAERFRRDLRIFVATAQTLDVPIVLTSVAHVSGDRVPDEEQAMEILAWRGTMPAAPVDVVLDAYRTYSSVIHDVADSTGVPYIDASTFGLTGWDWYQYGDPVHFNRAGAERMAQHMARALIEAGAIPTGARASEGS